MSGDWVVWAEDGDIWGLDRKTNTQKVLVAHEADQTDPVIDGSFVVWSDNRNGDYDLYVLNLETDDISSLVIADGDQHSPSMSEGRVVYVDQPMEGGAILSNRVQADIWLVSMDKPDEYAPLVQDSSEQRYPMIHGDRVVWSDFRNDAEGHYITGQGVNLNNGDVYGYDLAEETEIIVTVNEHKQLRPAVHGNTVVWLDWRNAQIGIEPLPKYDAFGLYSLDLTSNTEMFLAEGSWKQPDLWRRPALRDGHVAWIVEAAVGSEIGSTVQILSINGDTVGGNLSPTPVVTVNGFLEAIELGSGSVAWIGSGQLGIASLDGITAL